MSLPFECFDFRWGEEQRAKDPTIFCRLALEQKHEQCSTNSIWIVCDIRRYSDIEFFRRYFPECVVLVRVEASIDTREKRGWIFTVNVDDAESECQLDRNVSWSLIFSNNQSDDFEKQINQLIELIHS